MWGVVLMVVLGLCVLTGWLSSAEAVLTIRSAEVINGAAVVQGGNAPRAAPISWEGLRVTQANNGGNFAFQGMVPADCVGRLEDGVATDAVNVALANCSPVSEAPAPVPQTGQTTPFAAGDDGSIRAGVPWPSPRFTDRANGTVRDNLTGLIWLQDANCFDVRSWAQALTTATNLASPSCDLSDGSVAGDWRLPNVKELFSLIDVGHFDPALPAGHPFLNVVLSTAYWSSTTLAARSDIAWTVHPDGRSNLTANDLKSGTHLVWPVRGPE
jgi:Protein of unknown function (DUF1566)